VQVAVLPHTSTPRYVLVIVYLFAQVCALITSLTKVMVTVPPQLSVPDTNEISGTGTAEAQLTVIGAGQVSIGGVWSFTVINCVQVAVLPQTSAPWYVRVIVYLFVQVCALITSLTKVMVTVPPQLSVPDTNEISGTGTADAQLTVTGAGHVSIGGV
jgi:hypothetical protein